jgi:hypothetical protein
MTSFGPMAGSKVPNNTEKSDRYRIETGSDETEFAGIVCIKD